MTIRNTLFALFIALGAALCLSVALQVASAMGDLRQAQDLARSNQAREELARASLAIADERVAAYLNLVGLGEGDAPLAQLRARTDAILTQTLDTAASLDRGLSEVRSVIRSLAEARQVSDGARGTPGGVERDALAAFVLGRYTDCIDDLLALRLTLRAAEHSADPTAAAAFELRRFTSLVLENLALNRAIVDRLAAEATRGAFSPALIEDAERNSQRAQMAIELLEGQAATLDLVSRQAVEALSATYSASYAPVEGELLARLIEGRAPPDERLIQRWRSQSAEVSAAGVELLDVAFERSRIQIDLQRARAQRNALLWTALFAAGLGVVGAGTLTVLNRVIRPLERLHGSMLALAQGDLAAPLPETPREDEIGRMGDALRVFKANAIRRARLSAERLALHERLKETYRRLRLDLEAAAAVQSALLPTPKRIGSVRFQGRLRPSHFISGDTFDVLRQPNGTVHFFIIDVAGHGAAAALVSVASHYTLTQAIQRRQSGESLAGTVTSLNRDWPEHLPYFTMIMGELSPERGEGALVQAGHPSPLLLRRADGVEPLGESGLPIGVLPDADFEEIRFPFTPGDRLLLFSDGLSEAEDPDGRPFTEERLLALLRARSADPTDAILSTVSEQVRRWRNSDSLDDDMTLLMLEAVEE